MNCRAQHKRFRPAVDVAARPVDGCMVLVNLGTGSVHRLNATGRLVWELSGSLGADEIAHALELRFDVAAERLQDDVNGLLAQLVEQRLLEPA